MVRLSVILAFVASIAGCESGAPNTAGPASVGESVVTVFAAASTTNAIDEVKAAFTGETGVKVQTSYAASSTLAQQIANGAEPDVFLSANVGWADYVEGKTVVLQRHNLLRNRLVIIVPSDSQLELRKPEDLLSEKVEHLALADPDSVPAGKYAKQALIAMGLWDRLKGKVVPGKDVRHALTYVETGAAEAGIVYATDAAISKKVKVAVEIASDLTEPVLYPVLLLNHGAASKAAKDFYDYLDSPQATRAFEKFGFVVIPQP